MEIAQKTAINQGELLPDQLRQVRMNGERALLGQEKNPHQAARLLAEDPRRSGINLVIEQLESVDDLLPEFQPARPQKAAW